MTGTIKDILAHDVIALARVTPSGDYIDRYNVQPTADFVADVGLTEDQVADVFIWAADDTEIVDGVLLRIVGGCDLWMSDDPDAPPTRYVLAMREAA